MKGWYQRVVLPRLLNKEMGSKEFEDVRRTVLAGVSGVVLEIGVGPGYNFLHYGNLSKLYALEPSKELINIAMARAGALSFPVEFLNTEAEAIPLQAQSVDTVVSTWTLCSVADPKRVLQEIKRVLKPHGTFVFAEHGASPHAALRILQSSLTAVTKHFTGNCHTIDHLRKCSQKRVLN